MAELSSSLAVTKGMAQKLAMTTASAALMTVAMSSAAQAITLVKNVVVKPPVGEEPTAQLCLPFCETGDSITTDVGRRVVIENNIDKTLTSILYTIPAEEDAAWSKESISDIFSELIFSKDMKKLLLTSGSVAPGEAVLAFREADQNVMFDITVFYDGAPATVPEPTTLLGLLAVGALTATSAVGSRE
ncbi:MULTISPECIES: PEP-CTERM sorting domain-containing protein [unclassified Moorena]|uniref:PEP-CTERM sorting domain-containing protein n=1 Tax=unclassified Moorena TaxID=2683338 RepID=UPI001400D1C2|nr:MULTISPECIES: PEP-CTERM sorting domain-containing protein [unclassified Moorena]NEO17131.1 PEP-CTERM sorting domain-containing protein [Moorena sp. SIO3E8]NEQ03304.1 PEP-CTERM sorting domain-containing protein [Moorena sp. SIO3F7]